MRTSGPPRSTYGGPDEIEEGFATTDRATSPDAVWAKAEGENFPVALRVLPTLIRTDLQALYRYARFVDDLGDEAPGDRLAALDRVTDEVHALYRGERPETPAVTGLAPTVARCGLPAGPLLRLVDANRQDQRVTRYDTFEELVGYCELSANPVGELVLHVFGRATPDRVALSDQICTALQLVEHWQDVAEDHRRGRVYLPQDDLRRFGVVDDDLGRPVATDALRELIAFETRRAEIWLDAGAPLIGMLSGWSRLAVSGYLAGGRAACSALRRSGHDPLRAVPKATSARVLGAWVGVLLRRRGR